jgi:uncharacterized ferredoxin-like protein
MFDLQWMPKTKAGMDAMLRCHETAAEFEEIAAGLEKLGREADASYVREVKAQRFDAAGRDLQPRGPFRCDLEE